MPETRTVFSISDLVATAWPSDLVDLPVEITAALGSAFDWVGYDPRQTFVRYEDGHLDSYFRIVITENVRLPLPALDGAEIGLGLSSEPFQFGVRYRDSPRLLAIDGISFSLVMPPSILGKVTYDREAGLFEPVEVEAADGSGRMVPAGYEFQWTTGIETDLAGYFAFKLSAPFFADIEAGTGTPGGAPVPPVPTTDEDEHIWARIGSTPILLRASGINIVADDPPAELMTRYALPETFRGVLIDEIEAAYAADGASGVVLSGYLLAIGNGGFTGVVGIGDLTGAGVAEGGFDFGEPRELSASQLAGEAALPEGVLAVDLEGFEAKLQRCLVRFDESMPTASNLAGYLNLPMVDKWFRFRATFGGPNATFMIDVAGAGGEPLIDLSSDWLVIKADRISYLLVDSVSWVSVAGSVRPKIGDFDWPELKVEDLRISSEGEIDFKGGWVNLPEQRTFDFGGFKVHLSGIGFGGDDREDGGKDRWIGFSGGVSLVDGIPISASVEGLEFRWQVEDAAGQPVSGEVYTSLDGIALSFEIPGTLKLYGSISHVKEALPDGGEAAFFRGAARLDLTCLRAVVDAELMIGKITTASGRSETLFAASIDIALPAPILLGATGAGIYGFEGLFGMHVGPARKDAGGEAESWYLWWKNKIGDDEATAYTVNTLKKYAPEVDNYVVGAGLLLGTAFDGGTTFNIRALAVVIIPGPIIMIEGTANLLRTAGGDKTQEGAFYALIVFDGRADTFQINIDIRFAIVDVVDIGGGFEAFFDFANSRNWYIHIGVDEPRQKRLRAVVLEIVRAETYFMINNDMIMFGADIGIDWRGEYGPVSIVIVAKFGFGALIAWAPFLFEGMIYLEGGISVKIFGIGLGLEFYVALAGKTPSPWFIAGEARVKLSLPFPLPDVEAEVAFRWGEQAPLPKVDPLLDGLALIHHLATDVSWAPLAAERGLGLSALRAHRDLPVCPIDVTPVASFTRPVQGSLLPKTEVELLDGTELQYFIRNVQLYEVVDDLREDNPVRELHPWTDFISVFGFDQYDLMPDPDAQAPQLRLWRFDQFTGGQAGQVEFRSSEPDPCRPPEPQPWQCAGFETLAEPPANLDEIVTPDVAVATYRPIFVREGVTFIAGAPVRGETWTPRVTYFDAARSYALGIAGVLTIRLPRPASVVTLAFTSAPARGSVTAYSRGRPIYTFDGGGPSSASLVIDPGRPGDDPNEPAVDTVLIRGATGRVDVGRPTIGLRGLCFRPQGAATVSEAEVGPREREDRRPGQPIPGLPLKADTVYELRVIPAGRRRPAGSPEWQDYEQAVLHSFYFRTGGVPETPQDADWTDHKVNRLDTYVGRTVPAADAFSAYRAYDLAIEFAEPYARQFFEGRLDLVLRDRNGRNADGQTGTMAQWMAGMPILKPGLIAVALSRSHSTCSDPDPHAPEAPRIWRAAPPMSAQRRYVLEVAVTDVAGAPVRHRVPFVTSLFATATEHFRSGAMNPAAAEAAYVLRRPPGALEVWTAPDLSALGAAHAAFIDAVTAAAAAGGGTLAQAKARDAVLEAYPAWRAAAAAVYEALDGQWAPAFAARPKARELPPLAVEMVGVDTPAGTLLALRSPEPVDWQRISVLATREGAGGAAASLAIVPQADGAAAFIVPTDGTLLGPGAVRLTVGFTGGNPARPDLALVTREGRLVEERVVLKVEL